MGIFSSIKKLFFATESVAKSGAEKASDYTKDKIDDIESTGRQFADDLSYSVSEKTSGLRDSLSETGSNFIERSKEAANEIKEKAEDLLDDASSNDTLMDIKERAEKAIEDLSNNEAVKNFKEKATKTIDDISESEVVQKAASTSESVGDKILDTGEDFMEGVENLGNAAIDKTETLAERAKDLSEKVGSEILEKGKETADRINAKINETVAKAEKEALEEAQNPKGKFSDETLDTGGSLLDGEDDFFSKAAQYADGDYGAFSEGKITINEDKVPTDRREPAKAAGFLDRDNDGNELIDDAIISEEE